MRTSLRVAIAVILVAGVCATAWAEDSDRPGPPRARFAQQRGRDRNDNEDSDRPGPPRERFAQQRGRGRNDNEAGGEGQGLRHRPGPGMRELLNSEEAKAFREQMKKDIEAVKAEHKALHDKIRAEIDGGKKPQEVLPNYQDAFKALMKKRMLLGIDFREKLLGLARKNVDKTVDTMHGKIREEMKERRQQSGKTRRRPQGDKERRQQSGKTRRRHGEDKDAQ